MNNTAFCQAGTLRDPLFLFLLIRDGKVAVLRHLLELDSGGVRRLNVNLKAHTETFRRRQLPPHGHYAWRTRAKLRVQQ